MNMDLHLSKADLKYWINEFPIMEDAVTEIKKVQIPMREKSDKKYIYKKVALEVCLHKHAGNYALLGLEYMPDESGTLSIEVQYVMDNEIHYESDLTKFNNYKYLGLPEECLDLMIETITKSEKNSSGIVRIPTRC